MTTISEFAEEIKLAKERLAVGLTIDWDPVKIVSDDGKRCVLYYGGHYIDDANSPKAAIRKAIALLND